MTRSTVLGDISRATRRLMDRTIVLLSVTLTVEAAYLWFGAHPGAISFMLSAGGSLLVLNVWRKAGIALPIVPIVALQNLLAYCLPIAVSNESVMAYPEARITEAGAEVFVFSLCLAAAWRSGIQLFSSSPARCYALMGLDDDRAPMLSRLATALILAVTGFSLATSAGITDWLFDALLPGSWSIANALVSAARACGFFLGAMVLGAPNISTAYRIGFWLAVALNVYLLAASLLLSPPMTMVFSVSVGLFWKTGRFPWRFLATVVAVLAFLNLGKSEMRDKYWDREDERMIPITLRTTPSLYQEWASVSYAVITGASLESDGDALAKNGEVTGQSLADRVNNLQNILYVIDAVKVRRYEILNGATYALIPPLLIPRLFWPDKPRAHEGQAVLNVHFGRQSLEATYRTYIAWGLLAEAYGNFGSIAGAAVLGISLGLIFSFIERFVMRKLLLSLEGFLAFTLLIAVASSTEMVSSVLVTSLFQSFVTITIACLPFVRVVTPSAAAPSEA